MREGSGEREWVSEQKDRSQGNSASKAFCKLVLLSWNPQLETFSSRRQPLNKALPRINARDRPLIPLLNSKTLNEMRSPRLTRLKEKLAVYRFIAVWRPGVEHKVVDCFSRHPVDDPSPDEDDEAAAYVRAMLLGAHTAQQATTPCRSLILI